MELLVTQMRYQAYNNNIDVNILGRSDRGERVNLILRGIEPYFYVKEKPIKHPLIKRVEREGQNLAGEALWKIYVKKPSDVRELRSFFDIHYEADIPFADRIRFDLGIKHQIRVPNGKHVLRACDITPVEKRTIDPEMFCFDIETNDSKGFPVVEFAAEPVRSVSIWSTELKKLILIIDGIVDKQKIRDHLKELENKYFDEDGPEVIIQMAKDERDLFRKFTKIFKLAEPDIVTGWYSDGFDIPYMENRAQNKGYTIPNFKEYAQFDTQWGYKTLHKNKAHLKLEFAAKKTLGVGKLPRTKIHDMFENDKERLGVYNLWDVELTRRIEEVKGIIKPFHLNLAYFAGCKFEDAKWQEPLADKYMLHQTAGIVVVPSREMLNSTKEIAGGYVNEAVLGMYRYIAVIDFTSMYPNNVLSANISPETRVHEDPGDDSVFRLGTGRMYKKEPAGLIPMTMEKLLVLRGGVKKEMMTHEKGSKEYKALWEQQRAIKYFTNAVYGVLGSKNFRLADEGAANDVTWMGRELIKYSIKKVTEYGFKPLYADTDSVMFEVGTTDIKKAVELGQEVVEKLNKSYPILAREWNGEAECKHNVKLEKIYEAWFQPGAKKKYIGLVGWDGDTDEKFLGELPVEDRLDIKGLEIVRSNSAKITKETQEKVLIEALTNEDYREPVVKYLKQVHDDFFNGDLDNKIMIPTSWGKLDYVVVPAHERARIFSTTLGMLEVQPGDSYSWLYVKSVTGHPKTDVAAVEFDSEKLNELIRVDYDRMWERCVRKPLNNILGGLGITWEEILSGKIQEKLDEWF